MKLCKLTDGRDRTYGGCQWGEGVEHTASGEGDLCTKGWLHAYTHPLLAVLLNPIHADFNTTRLWEADGDVGKEEHGLKVGCIRLKTIRRIPLPEISPEQRVRFAILCALEVYHEKSFVAWAESWLDGTDRTVSSARLTGSARRRAEGWAAAAAAKRAALGTERAAWAASASASAARAAAAERAAAEEATMAAAAAGRAAAEAATMAAAKPIDLIALAEQACGGNAKAKGKQSDSDISQEEAGQAQKGCPRQT